MLAGGPLLGGRAHRAPGKLTARETNRRRQPPAFLASGRAPGLAVGRGPDGPSPKTHTTRDIVGLPCATGCRLRPSYAAYGRLMPRFHGAFIVRFTALSPSSQKSGDTVTFVNKDRMPRPVLPRRERLGKSDDLFPRIMASDSARRGRCDDDYSSQSTRANDCRHPRYHVRANWLADHIAGFQRCRGVGILRTHRSG